MLASGFLKYTEKDKAAQIMHTISEGNNIKELDFGYRVNSSLFEGVSVNVFNLNENIYIQKINKGMKENSFVLAESAEDAVGIVKDFMNYDISNSLTHLLETESSERIMREKELDKVQSRIKFLMESLGDLERVAKINGVENSTQIVKAKELLESQIQLQNNELAKITSKDIVINEDHCTPGQEYKIKGEGGWVYQGETDGKHIFNNDKGGKEPITYDIKGFEAAHKTKEIAECM